MTSVLSVVLTGWYVGWAIAGAVVLVVAALVLAIIVYAHRIGEQAQQITEALVHAREHTDPMWSIVEVNRELERAVGRRPGPPNVLQEGS